MVTMESRDSEGVPFASLESLCPGIWEILAPEGYLKVVTWPSRKLHIVTRRKIHWFQKYYSFRSTTKNNAVIAEKPFQNSGVTRRLAVLNWRSSSIHHSSSYCFSSNIVVKLPENAEISLSEHCYRLQRFDTVGWATGRGIQPLKAACCWLMVTIWLKLYTSYLLQLSPPRPSSLPPVISRYSGDILLSASGVILENGR